MGVNSQLQQLIDDLRNSHDQGGSITKYLKNPMMLIVTLEELNDFVGNNETKNQIVSQLRLLLLEIERNKGVVKTGDKMNIGLYGPPGTGKTSIAIIIAKVLFSIGYFKDSNEKFIDIFLQEVKTNGMGMNVDKLPFEKITQSELQTIFTIIVIAITVLIFYYSVISFANYGIYGLVAGILLLVLVIGLLYMFAYRPISKHIQMREVQKQSNVSVDEKSMIKDDEMYVLASRGDFVAGYVGHTAPKTNGFLLKNRGKVVVIDEAYTLMNKNDDSFGKEALDEINRFITEHPGEIVIIFAGYRDQLQSGIFTVQKGLERRIMWHFDCSGYNGDELYEIFVQQIQNGNWNITKDPKIKELIKKNVNMFPNYGGDTERLFFYSKTVCGTRIFNNARKDYVINYSDVAQGMNELRKNISSAPRVDADVDRNEIAQFVEELRGNMAKENKPKAKSQPYIERVPTVEALSDDGSEYLQEYE